MKVVHLNELKEYHWNSPKGKYGQHGKTISIALGREPESTDLMKRHPFDVEIVRVEPGKAICPYHSHSVQWEYYQVLEGKGVVRHEAGETEVVPGDCFLFKPGEAHTLMNQSDSDFTYLVVADNPIGESCHYPDSGKWLVRSPERAVIRSENLDYFDGEE